MATLPEELVEICIELRRLLIIYEGIRRNENILKHLLEVEIEKISKEAKGNFFIETLISEYPYPRKFYEEIDETFETYYEPDPFFLKT